MKKIVLIMSLALLMCTQVMAQNSDELLNRLKTHRADIYASLNLTYEQKNKINKLDNQIYQELEPDLKQISLKLKQLENLANSENCTIERVDAIKRDFEKNEQKISVIKNKYEQEFIKILTPEQRVRYNKAKREQEAKAQREIEALKNSLN